MDIIIKDKNYTEAGIYLFYKYVDNNFQHIRNNFPEKCSDERYRSLIQ